MTAPPPINFVWHPTPEGHVMVPRGEYYSRLAEQTFTSGVTYQLIVNAERAKSGTRSGEQNNKMWAMLTEISEQKQHCGRKYTPDQWKVLFMHALGTEFQFLPALDGRTFVPYGTSSSALTVAQMAELIEFITAWAAQNSINFRSDEGVTWK